MNDENKAESKQYMVTLGEAARRFCTGVTFGGWKNINNMFRGRTSRSEYWWLVLLCWSLNSVFGLTIGLIPGVNIIVRLIFFIIFLALGCRRMQDVGLPGILVLIPVLNPVCLLLKSSPKENKYGTVPNTKPVEANKTWTVVACACIGAAMLLLAVSSIVSVKSSSPSGFSSSANEQKDATIQRLGSARDAAYAAATKGINLFVAIVRANIEREAAGMVNVWPHKADDLSGDSDDVAGMHFVSSSAYFAELFDLKNMGEEKRSPYVDVGLDVLNLKGDNSIRCDWLVIEGVEAEMDDSIPVLVSANVDPKSLANAFAASGDKTSTIPVGSSIGRGFSEWADHYVVLLRKNGKADVIPASKFNGVSIMRGQNVNSPCVRYLDRGVEM